MKVVEIYTMFAAQIEGVSMELVRQGWRLTPTTKIIHQWLKSYLESGWDTTEHNGLPLWRPVIRIGDLAVYHHAGWGDGLGATPEMVKVWKWWWYKTAMGSFLRAVEVLETPEGLVFQCADMPMKPITQARGEWHGPVLPPSQTTPKTCNNNQLKGHSR